MRGNQCVDNVSEIYQKSLEKETVDCVVAFLVTS